MFAKCLRAINYLTSAHHQQPDSGAAEQTEEPKLEKVKAGGQMKGCAVQDSYRVMPMVSAWAQRGYQTHKQGRGLSLDKRLSTVERVGVVLHEERRSSLKNKHSTSYLRSHTRSRANSEVKCLPTVHRSSKFNRQGRKELTSALDKTGLSLPGCRDNNHT